MHSDALSKKTRPPINKNKVFFSVLLVIMIAVLGYFVVSVNRNIIGDWEYVDVDGAFSAELNSAEGKEGKPKTDADAINVKILISEKEIELYTDNKCKNKADIKISGNKIKGENVELEYGWSMFSLKLKGDLFGYKVMLNEMERADSAEYTLKNIMFIVIGTFLLLALIFVSTWKNQSYTRRMDSADELKRSSTKRTAIVKRGTEIVSHDIIKLDELSDSSYGDVGSYHKKNDSEIFRTVYSKNTENEPDNFTSVNEHFYTPVITSTEDKIIKPDKGEENNNSQWFGSAGDL